MPMGRLDGKVALVTGAARGQGRAHAVRLAQDGADIIAGDVCAAVDTVKYAGSTPEDLAETAALVEKAGRRCVADRADVRDLAQMEALVAKGVGELGRLDIVVANAGILSSGLTWELSPAQWREVIDTNLTGVWHTVRATVPTMIAQGQGGAIIVTSSTAGMKGQPFTAHYTAAKHGVVGLAKCLANELGEHRIRVNSIHPTGVRTEMVREPDLFPLIEQHATTLGPLFMNTMPVDFIEPGDVAGLVAFLASDEGQYMTGCQYPIDLGAINR